MLRYPQIVQVTHDRISDLLQAFTVPNHCNGVGMIWLEACLPVLISLGTYAQAGSWSSAAAEIETPAEDTIGTACIFSDRLDVPDDPDVSYTEVLLPS